MLSESHEANANLLKHIERANLGVWKPFYRRAVKSLKEYDCELVAHMNALAAPDTITLAFSKRDQEQLARILTNQLDGMRASLVVPMIKHRCAMKP